MLYPCTPKDIQQALGPFVVPDLKCYSRNKIRRICTNDKCKYDAMYCDDEECKQCMLHSQCSTRAFSTLTKKAQYALSLDKRIMTSVCEIQNKLIEKFFSDRKEFVARAIAWKYKGKFASTLDQIYVKGNIRGVKGAEIKEMLVQLDKKDPEEAESDRQIEAYRVEMTKMFDQMKNMRNAIIEYQDIKSKVLVYERDKYQYLLKQLGNPKQLKLLYRASQNNFSAYKFHELCDGKSNTVTILSTEFKKNIAAFNSLSWRSSQSGQWLNSSNNFLLQLDNKERLSVTQPHYAIYSSKDYGPTFGNGHNLFISHNANQNQNSHCNFAYSYNIGGRYQQNQQSYTNFCGSPNGRVFRVLEWQVFEVVK